MLKEFSQYVVYSLFNMQQDTRLSGAVEFFIYDTIKIFLLLAVIIFAVSVIRSYFPPERTKRILSHKKEFIGNILAALLGVVTPFCSCSAVPLFIGFIEAGVPLGVTFSFLISSPMVNEVALASLGDVRLEDRRHLYGYRPFCGDCCGNGHRQAEARKMGRGVRL